MLSCVDLNGVTKSLNNIANIFPISSKVPTIIK